MNYSAVDTLMEIFGFYRVNRQLTPEQSGNLVAYNTAMHDGNDEEIRRTRQELIESISDVVTGDNRVK